MLTYYQKKDTQGRDRGGRRRRRRLRGRRGKGGGKKRDKEKEEEGAEGGVPQVKGKTKDDCGCQSMNAKVPVPSPLAACSLPEA